MNYYCKTEQDSENPNRNKHKNNIKIIKNKVDIDIARGKIKLRKDLEAVERAPNRIEKGWSVKLNGYDC